MKAFPTMRIRLLSLAALTVLLSGCNDAKPPAPAAPPPPTVGVVTLAPRDVVIVSELAGRVLASRVAEVRPQVSGIIQNRLFIEGAEVREGEILYEIADEPYKAAFESATAALDRARGAVTAAVNKAERYRTLSNRDVASHQDLETARAAADQAKADVAAAQANLEAARINLDRTKVRAPIDGRIGTSALTVGALVTANQANALATIQTLDPVFVDVPQSAVMVQRMRSEIEQGILRPDPGGIQMTLLLDNGRPYKDRGILRFTNTTVSETTGTVTLRASFANPERLLLPGMFVRGTATLGARKEALLVTQRAVTRNPRGLATVMVVGEGDKAEERTIEVERSIGSDWIIDKGLAGGDRVIVEGLQRVRAGARVTPTPFVANAPQPAAGGKP